MMKKELVLDMGCGNQKEPGSIGLDVRRLDGVDIQTDAFRFFLPFRSGVFAKVRCIHFLEHANDLLSVMEEIHRVLVPKGILHIVAPHGGSLRFLGDPTHKIPITCSTFNYFLPDYPYNFYSTARFRIVKIDLLMQAGKGNIDLRKKVLKWFWEKRMWQMERLLTFLRVDFALEVFLEKTDTVLKH